MSGKWDCFPRGKINPEQVVRQGEKADPGNAFFPWIAAEMDLMLKDKAGAARELGRAVACRRYDDYEEQYLPDLLRVAHSHGADSRSDIAYLIDRAETGVGYHDVEVPVDEVGTLFGAYTRDPPGRAWRRDFHLVAQIVRLGKLQRTTAKFQYGRFVGAALELGAISGNCAWLQSADYVRDRASAAQLLGVAPTIGPLMRSANVFGRPDLARLMAGEWTAAPHWPIIYYVPPDHPDAEVAPMEWYQRIERIIVRTLPLCGFLLLINGWAGRYAENSSSARAGVAGAVWGGLCLGWLCAGDLVVSARSMGSDLAMASQAGWMIAWSGPGICSLMPWVVWGAVPIVLTGASLALVARMEASNRADQAAPDRPDFAAAMRGFAACGLWLLPTLLFFAGCRAAFGSNPPAMRGDSGTGWANQWVVTWSPAILVLLAFAAWLPWWLGHQRDRRRAFLLARAQLQGALVGYLVAATILYAALEVPRNLSERRFDVDLRRMVEQSE